MQTKNILLLVEKKSILSYLVGNKDFLDYLDKNNVYLAFSYGFTYYEFFYDKKTKYREYPLTSSPIFKDQPKNFNYDLTPIKSCNIKKTIEESFNLKDKSIQTISTIKYTEIIIISDCSYKGAFGCDLVLSLNSSKDWRKNIDNFYHISLLCHGEELNKSFNKQIIEKNSNKIIEEKEKFERLVEMGKIKRYFDFNYNKNSNVFFGEIFNKLNIKNKKTMSKFMLLLLFFIKEKESMSYIEMFSLMQNYDRGTGKYFGACSFGSPASRSMIINNLEEQGLIICKNKNVSNELYSISKNGIDFLNLVNNKMFDPDLPFRLEFFLNLKKEEAFEKINKYILTQFSKQKRKNKYLGTL